MRSTHGASPQPPGARQGCRRREARPAQRRSSAAARRPRRTGWGRGGAIPFWPRPSAPCTRARAVRRSTSTPGSSRPSRNSSMAWPPVETWLTRSSRPNSANRVRGLSSPDDGRSGRRSDGLRDHPASAGELRKLKAPHRAVPKDRGRRQNRLGISRRRPSPDVQPHPYAGAANRPRPGDGRGCAAAPPDGERPATRADHPRRPRGGRRRRRHR